MTETAPFAKGELIGPGWHSLGVVSDETFSKTWTVTFSGEQAEDLVPEPPRKCPHCTRDWHPEPLTNRIVRMLARHMFDPSYNPDTDESGIACVGADYHGPNRPPPPMYAIYSTAGYQYTEYFSGVNSSINTAMQKMQATMQSMAESFKLWTSAWEPIEWANWFPSKPDPCELPAELPKIEFGEWKPTTQPVHVPPQVKKLVASYWHDLIVEDFPVPDSPGYDFSAYADKETSYPTSGKAWK